MKNLFTLLIMVVLVNVTSKAANKMLQIWQADGQIVTINLNEEPCTTYNEGNLIITTTKTTITYPLEQIKRYTYADDDGVSEDYGELDGVKSVLSDDGETLSIKGLKSNAEIQLYSAAGQLLRTFKPKSDKVAVSISQFPTGVYIVKANGITYKITKR